MDGDTVATIATEATEDTAAGAGPRRRRPGRGAAMTPEALAERLRAVYGGAVHVRRTACGAGVTCTRWRDGEELDVLWLGDGEGPWLTVAGAVDARLAAALALVAELAAVAPDPERGVPDWFGPAQIAACRADLATPPVPPVIDLAAARQRRAG
jgi:hypothetical protein